MFYTYILRSAVDNSFYIGHTQNLNERINKHNFENSRYTKLKRPWEIVYSEEFTTRGDAIKREYYFKRLKNRKYLKKIIGLGP